MKSLVIIFLFPFIGAVLGQIPGAIVRRRRKKEFDAEFAAAKKTYLAYLQNLKVNPNNAALAEQTIAYGRVYAQFVRESDTEMGFDEVTLMKEVHAARSARDNPTKSITSVEPAAPLTIEERLNRLSVLKSQRLISSEEFDSRRKVILDEL